MATLKDVAKLAGVDPSIVSRTINNDPSLSIKVETRERILQAVKQLNYRPNVAARNLKKGESKVIGLAITDFYNPVFPQIIQGAEARALQEGYHLLVYSAQQHKEEIIHSLRNGRIDGLIISSTHFTESEILAMVEEKLPVVIVNRKIANLNNFVVTDDINGSFLAVNYLIENNHKKIAQITGPLFTTSALDRLHGYRRALMEANITYHQEYVKETDFTFDNSYDAMMQLLELEDPPTAVFASNISTSLGAMKAIREKGLQIPEDISLMGFHDVYFSDSLWPPLTTVKMPLIEMGEKGVEKLLSIIRKNDNNQGVIITGAEILVRNSIKKL